GQKLGHNVHFGDMTNPEISKAAGLADASAVVVTLENAHQAERVISNVRVLCPSAAIYARAKDFKVKAALLSGGVSHAVPEAAEGIIQLGTAVLRGIGASDSDVETLVADFRRDDYALMQEVQGT
ncbi:MAG: NAD-binding protein, partial [Kiloniellales bacterium]|nr:NAD-binding protein [Kiloniellales bacterium]